MEAEAPRAVPELSAVGLSGIPQIESGDDLVAHLVAATRRAAFQPEAGDVFVVAQKIVSKAEGRVVRLSAVQPSALAHRWAAAHGKDPRVVEVVLTQTKRLVRMDHGVMICETLHGFVCANAGVDTSNVGDDCVTLLPADPDASAERLRVGLSAAFDASVAVIVTDTFGRPWREGVVDVAIGVAGLSPLVDYRGRTDTHGRELRVTIVAVADQIASAAELVMGKTSGIPAAIVRLSGRSHLPVERTGSGRDLLRSADRDLFR